LTDQEVIKLLLDLMDSTSFAGKDRDKVAGVYAWLEAKFKEADQCQE